MSAEALQYRHQRVTRLRRLLSRRSVRQTERAYVVEGSKLVEEALDRGAPVEAVYWSAGAPPGLLARAHDAGVRTFPLADGVLARVTDVVTPQPILAVVAIPRCELADLRGASMILVGAEVRDPGNGGTLLRTARAAGADGVVWCRSSVDVYNPKTVRASAGALFGLSIVTDVEPAPVMRELASWGVRRLAAVPEGGRDYAGVDLTGRFALMVGNEAHGLAPDQLELVDELITVPMAGGTESLNVGMATAVVCFEAARQRRLGSRDGR